MKIPLPVVFLSLALLIPQTKAIDSTELGDLQWILVSTLTPQSTKVGHDKFEAGVLIEGGGPRKVQNRAVGDGLYAHAPSKLVYDISGKGFEAVKGSVALEDDFYGDVKFRILGDGKVLWESGEIKKISESRPAKSEDFVVDISHVATLELDVDDLGSNKNDHAVWIRPAVGKKSL